MSSEALRQVSLETILRPGEIVGGRYRVDALIAEGGMAAVWAGVNQRTGKRVALKVILRLVAALGEAAELFRREALAASKVNHPNVVNIFDVIDHEGMTCIVMELLEGETLAAYLAAKGPLDLEEAVALLLPAMHGVAAANAMGVIHRDLKPGNIFLCSGPDGRLVTTKVLDFGISMMAEPSGETSLAIEMIAKCGTPAYMAPEAIQGSAIDARADVYAFGVLLFEALTGKLPFPGEANVELLAHILTEAPPKLVEYRPDLPPEVGLIVDRALAKDASDRFPDVDSLIHATEDYLLPAQSVTRALTPMAGISFRQLIESKSGAGAPAVRAVHENEPSSRVRTSETRVLYSFAGEPLRAIDRTGIVHAKNLWIGSVVHWARRRLDGLPDSWRPLTRRTTLGLALALAFLSAMVVYLAVSRPSDGRSPQQARSSSPSSTVVHGPTVTPLSITRALPATPQSQQSQQSHLATFDQTVAPSGGTEGATEPRPIRVPPPMARGAAVTYRSPMGAARPLPASRRLRSAETTRRGRRASHTSRLPLPTAGRLSPSDF